MTPVLFPEQNTVAKGDHLKNGDGSPMGNLPAYIGHGQVVSCWRVSSFKERLKLFLTGEVWLSVMSRGIPPQSVSVDSPFEPVTATSSTSKFSHNQNV